MEKVIAAKKKQVNNVLDLLKGAKISSPGFKSSDQPCFMSEEKVDDFVMSNKSIPELPDGLNRHIKILYEIIGPDKEVYIGDWTIMSLNEALERYKIYCSEGQKNVFDIGYKYAGMGHIDVIACNIYNHLLFNHHDGGSNGYDRIYNHDKMVKYDYKVYEYMVYTNWAEGIKGNN